MTVVLVHPDWGIYLGGALGLAFWSKIDPVGQDAACAFPDAEQAQRFVSECGWDMQPIYTVVVAADIEGQWASMASCMMAGLPGWMDATTPTIGGVQ